MKPLLTPSIAFFVALGLATAPAPARAALEEYESWSVAAYELDDENGLDDLHRGFSPWEDWAWRASTQGARVGMGCATTQTWELDLDAKLQRWLGHRVGVGYRYDQQEELGESVTWNEFSAWYRAPRGFWGGGTYRPSFDKERHDAGLFAGWYGDSARWVRGYLGFEDALNNFWEGRTEYIQDLARRRYERNPRELELSGLWLDRGRGGLSLRLTGIPRYVRTLTPGPAGDGLASRLELAGWQGYADAFHDLGSGWAAGLRARLKGCDRKDYTGGAPGAVAYASRDFARLRDVYARPWLERRLGRGWRLRGLAQARWSSERHDAGAGAHVLETRHLGGMATVGAGPWTFLDLEVGLAEDWVRVKQRGPAALDAFTHGTRNEARAVIQVDLHRDGAHLVLIETFEGNREGYQTVGFHDKGFAHLVIEF